MYFQLLGILILLAFYSAYFLKVYSQHKKGIHTDQIGKGKTGFVRFVEVTMKIASILAPVVELISLFLNTSFFPQWVRWIGFLSGITGVSVFILSMLTMRDNWKTGVSRTDHTSLITTGIYRFSRNPAFLGFDLVYFGFLLMFFNRYLLLSTFFAALMLHLQIVNVEEDFLLETFGDAYLSYRKSVHRYIGRKGFFSRIFRSSRKNADSR